MKAWFCFLISFCPSQQTLFQLCELCWHTLCIWSICVWQSSSSTLSLVWSLTSPSTLSSTSGSLPQRPTFWWVWCMFHDYCSVLYKLLVYYGLRNHQETERGKAFLPWSSWAGERAHELDYFALKEFLHEIFKQNYYLRLTYLTCL